MSYALPTKAETVAEFKERYPQCADARASVLYRSAYRWVMDNAELRWSSVDINLTSGTREYDLSATVARVETVEYHESSTSFWKLESTTLERLEATRGNWRDEEGEPQEYYVYSSASTGNLSKNVIGLVQEPQTTTSGGFPILKVRGQIHDDPSDSDAIPPAMGDNRAILNRMFALYCEMKEPKDAPFFHQVAKQHLQETIARVKSVGDEEETRIVSIAAFAPRRR